MKSILILKIALVVSIASLLVGIAPGQVTFGVVKVPGASPNSLISINNNGQVVVNAGTSDSYQISVWSRLGGSQPVGVAGTNTGGAAIDLSGDVVGSGDPNHSGALQAFLAQSGLGAQFLGNLGASFSVANGINNQRSVVGFSLTAAFKQHAFLWTSTTGMQDLTPALTSNGGATAEGVNSSNQVVGYYFPNGSNKTLGFSWTQAGGLQDIGTSGTLAHAINDSGIVVGETTVADGNQRAFSWTQAGGLKNLGSLGGPQSAALGINSNGWIVGNSLNNSDDGLLHGFLWTPTGGMKDFIEIAGFPPTQQTYAAKINDFGVIALSTNKGGYLLVPKMVPTISSSQNPSALGQPVTLTVTVSSVVGAPPDGETVQFTTGATLLGAASLQGGVAQLTTSTIPAGSRTIFGTYVGDANFLSAKVKFIQVVQ